MSLSIITWLSKPFLFQGQAVQASQLKVQLLIVVADNG